VLNISLTTDLDKLDCWVMCKPVCNIKLNLILTTATIPLHLLVTMVQNLFIPRVSGGQIQRPRCKWEQHSTNTTVLGHKITTMVKRKWFIIPYRLFVVFFFAQELFLQLSSVYSWYTSWHCFPEFKHPRTPFCISVLSAYPLSQLYRNQLPCKRPKRIMIRLSIWT
jgi:hypothetical protein